MSCQGTAVETERESPKRSRAAFIILFLSPDDDVGCAKTGHKNDPTEAPASAQGEKVKLKTVYGLLSLRVLSQPHRLVRAAAESKQVAW